MTTMEAMKWMGLALVYGIVLVLETALEIVSGTEATETEMTETMYRHL